MDAKIREMWVTALRSGAYTQTKNNLRDSTGFCCLGVLCDLFLKENPDSDAKWELTCFPKGEQTFVYTDKNGRSDAADMFLPRPVMEWSGLPSENPEVFWDDPLHPTLCADPLSRINDESGCSFQEIAAIIEQNFPKLWRSPRSRETSLAEQIQEDIISFIHSSNPPRLTQSDLDSLCEIVAQNFRNHQKNERS